MWSGIYQPLLPFLKFLFYSDQRGGGGGHGPMSPLAQPVTMVQPGFINGGPKRGSEATERGKGVGGGGGGVPPSLSREMFENSCMKTLFSCTLNSIIRPKGVGFVKWHIYTNTLLPPPDPPVFFFFFLLQSMREKHGPLYPLASQWQRWSYDLSTEDQSEGA